MKILVIMKRFGANKDMVMDNFGRKIRLFEPLAKKHKINFFCPDYTKKESKIVNRSGIRYIIVPASLLSPFKIKNSLEKLIEKEKYSIIVAATDPLIGILAHKLSKKYKIPLIYDLQDNFESYDSYKLPFVRNFDRKVLREADFVLSLSDSLENHISKIRKKPIEVIHNGIDLFLFKDINKNASRKKLKLPSKSKIIVFIGHLEKLKGGKILLDAFRKVRKTHPDTFLLLSGRINKDMDVKQKNIIIKKFPKRQEIVLGINAADVAVLPNPVNSFTKYCFPYKLVEYMACNTPIVATDVGDVSLMLSKYKGSLCKPDNSDDLAAKIIARLKKGSKVNYSKDVRNLAWKKLAEKLDRIINKLG